MFVSQCLKHQNFDRLNCFSDQFDITTCFCDIRINNHTYVQLIDVNDLYIDKYAKDIKNKSTEIWHPSKALRVEDCLNENNVNLWKCSIYQDDKTKTYCICKNLQTKEGSIGRMNTKNILKNIIDKDLQTISQQIISEDTRSAAHDYGSKIDNINNTFDSSNLFHYENQENNELLIIFCLLMCISFLLLGLISNKLYKMGYKYSRMQLK